MFTPDKIRENYIQTAKTKTTLAWYKLLILAVLAGMFIAFGAAFATFVSADFTGSAAALVKGAVFPVGLILVVVCGAELFTGNCLLIAPAVNREIGVKGLFKNLGLAYAGNFIGSVIIALIAVYSHAMPQNVVAACVAAASGKCALNFGEALLRGILCNMLVCLAVWAAMASRSTVGKIAAVYLPVFAFVACGFEHSVADMYYLTAGLLTGAQYGISADTLTVGNSLLCLLAATIGNVIGGGAIALAYNAVYGKRRSRSADIRQTDSAVSTEQTAEAAASADAEKQDTAVEIENKE